MDGDGFVNDRRTATYRRQRQAKEKAGLAFVRSVTVSTPISLLKLQQFCKNTFRGGRSSGLHNVVSVHNSGGGGEKNVPTDFHKCSNAL